MRDAQFEGEQAVEGEDDDAVGAQLRLTTGGMARSSQRCPSGHSLVAAPERKLYLVTQTTAAQAAAERTPSVRKPRIHRAWFVAAVTFVTIIGAAAFRSLPVCSSTR
ncbi:hypothetical protein SALBM311S_12477 [Streptomyces alboniger]